MLKKKPRNDSDKFKLVHLSEIEIVVIEQCNKLK